MKKSDVIKELQKKGIRHNPKHKVNVLIALLLDFSKPRYRIVPHFLHKAVSDSVGCVNLNSNASQDDLKRLYDTGHKEKITYS